MFKHNNSYYKERLSALAKETFDPNPNFPFGGKQSTNASGTIVEEFDKYYKVYRNESLRNIFQKSLTSYIAFISIDDSSLDLRVKMKNGVLAFYVIWFVIFLSLIIYLMILNDFSWMMFALMLIGACIHIPLGRRKFKKYVIRFLNSL